MNNPISVIVYDISCTGNTVKISRCRMQNPRHYLVFAIKCITGRIVFDFFTLSILNIGVRLTRFGYFSSFQPLTFAIFQFLSRKTELLIVIAIDEKC